MTKTYIVPCIMEVTDTNYVDKGCLRTRIGPWGFMVRKTIDTVETLGRIGVEVDLSKMERLAKQNKEKFDRETFLRDFTDTIRDALNELVKGEPQ